MLNHKFLIILVTSVLFLTSCYSPKTIAKNTDFKFNVCKATYKGKALPFEQPIEEWKNFFGQSPRLLHESSLYRYTWDSIGVFVEKFIDEYDSSKVSPDELYIFFENLEHPVAQTGKFQFANGRLSLDYIVEDYKKAQIELTEERFLSIKERKEIGSDAPKNYPYPMHSVYKDTLLVDDVALYRGITLEQYNKQRALVGGAGKVGYWDRDMDLINERWSTRVETGEFVDFEGPARKEYPCAKNDNYYFLITYRFTEKVLEYIKIQKVEKGKSFYWK